MPELPEVETILRSLEPKALGCKIQKVAVLNAKTVKKPDPASFANCLEGQEITGFSRRGKYLLIEIGVSWVLVVHLRMTGRLIFTETDAPCSKYTCVIFYLDQGKEIRFQDVRKFGTMHLLPYREVDTFSSLSVLGYDAFDPQLSLEIFRSMLKGRRGQLKALLLNQSFIAGIGNIYANEILWKAGLHPGRLADSLKTDEQKRLYQAIKDVLKMAIKHRGTTLRDYVDGDGNRGEFQNLLSVHGREGEPCPCCGNTISRIKQGGRSTYFCVYCQK